MKQPSQEPIYGELHSMSFIELFHLCVAIAGWSWARKTNISLIVERAQECDRRRSQQPAYAAILLHECAIARSEAPTIGGSRIGSCITAW